MYMRVVFTDLTPYAEGPNLKIPQIHHAFWTLSFFFV
jgi:hypothetical protein